MSVSSEPETTICRSVPCPTIPLLMQVPSTAVAVDWALAFLGCMRLMAPKPCVILDIDGTVLLNASGGLTKCVLHFKSLCDACSANGIALFCVTARPEDSSNRLYTLRQLEKCGIKPIRKVYMRPSKAEYARYKYNARKEIATSGHAVLLTIGDQFADISLEEPPREIDDTKIYIGQMADGKGFGIKLSSEFA
uniref:Polynucleotide kinase n=1 Tax=viral metagenome TaxID=1070528 RepID=A0A6C0BZV6_9ZZZZ